MPSFNKPFLTIDQQIALLKGRGLIIENENFAQDFLTKHQYYRISAYSRFFQELPSHNFYLNSRFADIVSLYEFDKSLRFILFEAIEDIEVSVRSIWAYQSAKANGIFGYADVANSVNSLRHSKWLSDFKREYEMSRETFIEGFKLRYDDPFPPVWMACEILSLGQLSKAIKNTKTREIRRAVASPFGIREEVFESAMHNISSVRNICAHHGRLWNRALSNPIEIPKSDKALRAVMFDANPNRIHNTLVIVDHMLSKIDPENRFKQKLRALFKSNPIKDFIAMGFSEEIELNETWLFRD